MIEKNGRVIVTLIYLLVLTWIQWWAIGSGFPLNEKLLWFANGVASLLLGSRLLNPHFVPPADVATNSFVAAGTLVAALATKPTDQIELAVIWTMIAACGLCFLVAITVLLVKQSRRRETRRWVDVLERSARGFGAPRIIFTFVILALVWVFHRESVIEVFSILTIWTLIVALGSVGIQDSQMSRKVIQAFF